MSSGNGTVNNACVAAQAATTNIVVTAVADIRLEWQATPTSGTGRNSKRKMIKLFSLINDAVVTV